LAVAGGRNLTAAYFSDDQDQNFADLDLLVGGAAVRRLSRVFDEYWNSDLTYPIEALVTLPGPQAPGAPHGPATAPEGGMSVSRFDLTDLKLVPAPVRVLADKPEKVTFPSGGDEQPIVYDDVLSILRGAQHEVLIMSPYFIPVDEILALLQDLRARGVSLRVLTNSLASTDMPPVFAAYARRRRQLLQTGVELYELRPTPGEPRGLLKSFTPSKTALHAKAALVDQRIVFVGSMNLDPRSKLENTEDGLVIFSSELGARMAGIFARGTSPANSYAVHLSQDGRTITWVAQGPDGQVHYSHEPEAGVLRRLLIPLLRVTLPEALL
jgi:phosphatidylserine/phosphatidylglycerophosphate/cardiolipin synthase-like enzyme